MGGSLAAADLGAVHMAAVTQISHRCREGRACYDKKIAEGKTPNEALQALKRKVSDAFCNNWVQRSQGPRGGRPP